MNLNIIPNILFSPRIITMPLKPFNGFVNGINIPMPPNRILIGHPNQHLVVPYPLINRFRIIDNNQPVKFKNKIAKLIPMGRMAGRNEYESSILYLISDASSYMNGAVLVVDGGRTII